MKKQVIVGAVATLLFGTVSLSFGGDRMQPPEPFLGQMVRVLDLTADQQTQVKAIMKAEHDANAPLMQQQADLRKQLRQAEWAGSFDESAVLGIAASLAQVEEELTVARAKARFQVNTLLTTAQRALAQKLEPPAGLPGPPPFAP